MTESVTESANTCNLYCKTLKYSVGVRWYSQKHYPNQKLEFSSNKNFRRSVNHYLESLLATFFTVLTPPTFPTISTHSSSRGDVRATFLTRRPATALGPEAFMAAKLKIRCVIKPFVWLWDCDDDALSASIHVEDKILWSFLTHPLSCSSRFCYQEQWASLRLMMWI